MSKLSQDDLSSSINDVRKFANTDKKRKFVESVELQIGLKNLDLARTKKFTGTVVLPFKTKTKMTFLIIGDQKHIDEATALGLPHIDSDGLSKFKKDKKIIKKWAKQYDGLLASDSLVRQIPRLAGPQLNKMGKFPSPASHELSLTDKLDELRRTVKFQMKKVNCMGLAVGTVDLETDQIAQNINLSLNTLISLLPKGWQNIRSLHIKSSMGPPQRIF